MIKIPPCDLPMVPMVPLAAENVQGFLVTIGKNGTNSTIGRFADFTIGRTPNVANDSTVRCDTTRSVIEHAIDSLWNLIDNLRNEHIKCYTRRVFFF